MKPLAIFGGTFDPVHIGHLSVAWEIAEWLEADVRLVPVNIPPHRPAPIANAAQRLAMLQAALQGQQRLTLDLRELQRAGPSYTVDTMLELRAEQGDRPLLLLLGADAFAGLPSWRHWRQLFELAHLGVLSRPGVEANWPLELAQEMATRWVADPRELRDRPAGGVAKLAVTPLEVSATRIRELLRAGRLPRYLLPPTLSDQPALLDVYRKC